MAEYHQRNDSKTLFLLIKKIFYHGVFSLGHNDIR